MSHHASLNSHVLSFMPNDLSDRVILDVGCGFGEWGFLIRTRKSGVPYLVGLDIWRPHLERLCKLRVYDELIFEKFPPIPLRDKSVDISLSCEILEHLPKEVCLELLWELERVTKELIIVSTPLNWPQEEVYGNSYERHVSSLSPRDFAQRGYETKVVHIFTKSLRVVDGVRRFIFRLPPTPKLIVARKLLTFSPEVQRRSNDKRVYFI